MQYTITVSILFLIVLILFILYRYTHINVYTYVKKNISTATFETYGDIDIDIDSPDVYLIKIKRPISFDRFVELFKDTMVRYSETGFSNRSDGSIKYSDYILSLNTNTNAKKYLFDTTMNSKIDTAKIFSALSLPKYPPVNTSIALYSGQTHTGTHFHAHDSAYNYLVKGKKIWMVMNEPNSIELMGKLFTEQMESSITAYDWFIQNVELYSKRYKNINIFIQEEGDVVFVPNGKYHFALNLEPSYGIFYEGKRYG